MATMTREDRERQLRALMQTDAGRMQIVELYKSAKGMPMGTMPPTGMLMSQMIAEIVDSEFGNQ